MEETKYWTKLEKTERKKLKKEWKYNNYFKTKQQKNIKPFLSFGGAISSIGILFSPLCYLGWLDSPRDVNELKQIIIISIILTIVGAILLMIFSIKIRKEFTHWLFENHHIIR